MQSGQEMEWAYSTPPDPDLEDSLQSTCVIVCYCLCGC